MVVQRLGGLTRGNGKPDWSRNGQREQGDLREGDEGKGINGNDERMQVLKHDGNEVPMQCE